jgi:hypothetical protein
MLILIEFTFYELSHGIQLCFLGRRNSQCYSGLGLEDGSIKNEWVSANTNNSGNLAPEAGRLNNPNGAWCYTSFVYYEKIIFNVDLGEVRLVSGFQSQGPPTSVHPEHYMSYVGLRVRLSIDGVNWHYCCRDDTVINYQQGQTLWEAKKLISIFRLADFTPTMKQLRLTRLPPTASTFSSRPDTSGSSRFRI